MKKNLFLALIGIFLTVASCQYKDLPEGIYAEIKTDKGDILIELFYKATPMTVANFVGLAEGSIKNSAKEMGTPFFDGLRFHRVIEDFMIQGGDPLGTGAGDPGYSFDDEFVDSLKHEGPGILSMANSGPNTNGCQFFITHKSTPWLDQKHTVFGKVLIGQDVVDTIKQNDLIEKVTIIRIGKDAEKFDAPEVFKAKLKEKAEIARQLMEEKEKKRKAIIEEYSKGAVNTEITSTGLAIITLSEGNGVKPTAGQDVSVNYKGMLINGKVFDASNNHPITFKLGIGRVISGWDEGIQKVSFGSKAVLVIPSALAYGPNEMGGGIIPANSDLIFEIELLNNNK